MSLEGIERIHFIGIGGAGMSAIAKVLLERGFRITGSDLKRSRALTTLEAMGADIGIGHEASRVEGADLAVVSTAIPEGNPERRRAEELGIPIIPRGQALAEILDRSRSIVVAGTHGKTTTTSMIVTILRHAQRDPTYLIGGGLNDAGTNARSGSDDLAIAESDESDGSFLRLAPSIAVITNVEPDHLDHWGSYEEMLRGFERFASTITECAVVPVSGPALAEHLREEVRLVTWGEGGDVSVSDVHPEGLGSRFTLSAGGEDTEVHLHIPGEHKAANAAAAAAATLQIGLSLEEVAAGLAAYRGVERRFQLRGEAHGVTVIDDYAHHPTEVKATLAAARPGPWKRVVAVFQPHRYSRTQALWREFGDSFGDADTIVITDVYGAGEQPVPGVTGKLVADAICTKLPGRSVAYFPHRAELLTYLHKSARPGDALLTLGAGDVTAIGEELLARLGADDVAG